MPYQTVLNALKSRIGESGLLEFSTDDIDANGDFSILAESHRYCVVLDYAGMQQERATFGGGYDLTWRIVATLAVAPTNYRLMHDEARDLRQHVMDKIGTLPSLGIEVLNAEVTAGEDVPEIIREFGPDWAVETLMIEVTEAVTYTEED
jgi:hypothetical protein